MLIEKTFDTYCEVLFPHVVSQMLDVMKEFHEKQDPPYSQGILMIEIHRAYRHRKYMHRLIMRDCAF